MQGTRRRRVLVAHKMLSDAAMRRLSSLNGGLAQLGEHLLCKQGVVGSIPSSSTTSIQCGTDQNILSGILVSLRKLAVVL